MGQYDEYLGKILRLEMRRKIRLFREQEQVLSVRLQKLPPIFRCRIASLQQQIKGFNYFYLALEISCCELALRLHAAYPLGKYQKVCQDNLSKLQTDLTLEQRWYALGLANALFADEMTDPKLPDLEKFHIMRAYPLWREENYWLSICRIVHYRNSPAFQQMQTA